MVGSIVKGSSVGFLVVMTRPCQGIGQPKCLLLVIACGPVLLGNLCSFKSVTHYTLFII